MSARPRTKHETRARNSSHPQAVVVADASSQSRSGTRMLPSLGRKISPSSSLAGLERADDPWEQHSKKQAAVDLMQSPEPKVRKFKLPTSLRGLQPEPEPEISPEEYARLERKREEKRRRQTAQRLHKLREHALEVQKRQELKLPQLGALAKFATPGNLAQVLRHQEEERQRQVQRKLEIWQSDKKRRDAMARKRRQRERRHRTAADRRRRAERAASMIQKSVRKFRDKLHHRRRQELEWARAEAALLVQRQFRIFLARRFADDLRKQRDYAIAERILQRVVLNYGPQRELYRRRHNTHVAYDRRELHASGWARAIQIQRAYRGYVSRRGMQMPHHHLAPVSLLRRGGNKATKKPRVETRVEVYRRRLCEQGVGGGGGGRPPVAPNMQRSGRQNWTRLRLLHSHTHTLSGDTHNAGKKLWVKYKNAAAAASAYRATQRKWEEEQLVEMEEISKAELTTTTTTTGGAAAAATAIWF